MKRLTCRDMDLATTERILSRTSLESFCPLALARSFVNQVLCSSALRTHGVTITGFWDGKII